MAASCSIFGQDFKERSTFDTRQKKPPIFCVPLMRFSDRESTVLWIQNIRDTGSVLRRKPTGRSGSVRAPENDQDERQPVLQSPKRSTRKDASALRLSYRTVRRIPHTDLKFQSYKLTVVQELGKPYGMLWGYLWKCSSQVTKPTFICLGQRAKVSLLDESQS